MNMIREEHYKWVWAAIFLLAAVLCFTLIHDLYVNWGFTKYAVTYLDNKANTVLGMTGASTSASVAITMIPGDIGTPIATELANISSYSIILLAALHLEKYLITLAGEILLKFVVPAALVIMAINVASVNNYAVKALTKKLCAFSAAAILLVPASVGLCTMIEKTYDEDVQLSIEQTQKDAEEIKQKIENSDSSVWQQFINSLSGGTITLVNQFENSLNNFVEAVAVMLITSCVIPVLTFMMLVWLFKMIFQLDVKIPMPQLDTKRIPERYRIQGGAANGTKKSE